MIDELIDIEALNHHIDQCFPSDPYGRQYVAMLLDGVDKTEILHRLQSQGFTGPHLGLLTFRFRRYLRQHGLSSCAFIRTDGSFDDRVETAWRERRRKDNPIGLYMASRVPVVHRRGDRVA